MAPYGSTDRESASALATTRNLDRAAITATKPYSGGGVHHRGEGALRRSPVWNLRRNGR